MAGGEPHSPSSTNPSATALARCTRSPLCTRRSNSTCRQQRQIRLALAPLPAPLPHAAAPHGRRRVPRRQDHRRPHARRFLNEMGPQGEAQAQRRPRLQRASSRGALGELINAASAGRGPSPPSDIGGGAVGRHSTSHLTAPTLSLGNGYTFHTHRGHYL